MFFSDTSYLQFFGDDFLRLLTLRFVFCSMVLRAHRAFKVSRSIGLLHFFISSIFSFLGKKKEVEF